MGLAYYSVAGNAVAELRRDLACAQSLAPQISQTVDSIVSLRHSGNPLIIQLCSAPGLYLDERNLDYVLGVCKNTIYGIR